MNRLSKTGVGAMLQTLRRFRREGWRSAGAYVQSRLTNAYLRWRNKGSRNVQCPICGWEGRDFFMLDCGQFVVPHVTCPQCLSQERHRLLHLYLTRRDRDFLQRQTRVLHFAPEAHVRNIIDSNPRLLCFSTDFSRDAIQAYKQTAFQSDIQRLPVKDNVFGTIFCLHVLEHVPDDRVAISELHRVLQNGGIAYIMVPLMMGWAKTIEFGAPDPTIFNHVRGYSPADFRDRLAPLAYEEITAPGFLSTDEIQRYRIPPDSQIIYRCTKR